MFESFYELFLGKSWFCCHIPIILQIFQNSMFPCTLNLQCHPNLQNPNKIPNVRKLQTFLISKKIILQNCSTSPNLLNLKFLNPFNFYKFTENLLFLILTKSQQIQNLKYSKSPNSGLPGITDRPGLLDLQDFPNIQNI